jgi:hypothetical protein
MHVRLRRARQCQVDGVAYRLSPLQSARGNGIAENDGLSAQHLAGGTQRNENRAFVGITEMGLSAEGLFAAHVLTFSNF